MIASTRSTKMTPTIPRITVLELYSVIICMYTNMLTVGYLYLFIKNIFMVCRIMLRIDSYILSEH